MKTIAITGASGFIGGHALREFANAGYYIRAIVRSDHAGHRIGRLHDSYRGSFEVIVADLNDKYACVEAMADCDGLIHFASPLPGSEPPIDDARLIASAFQSTETVMTASAEA